MKKITTIQNLLTYITYLTEILPLIFCVLFYKKLNTKALKVFFIYTIVLTFLVLLGLITLYILKSRQTYLLITKLYYISEYCFFAIFLHLIFNNSLAKKIVFYSIFPFLLISISSYFISSNSIYSNYPLLIEFLAFIIFIIYFFYEKMNIIVEYPLYQSISFWICMGFFIYFTGNFFVFLFINSSKEKLFISQMKFIYSFVTICKNVLLCVAFLATEKVESKDDILHIPSDLDLDSFNPKTTLN